MRNLRGLAESNQADPPRQGLQRLQQGLAQPARPGALPDNNRYFIELDVCPMTSAQNQKEAKMSIEQIKQEQSKTKNNQIS